MHSFFPGPPGPSCPAGSISGAVGRKLHIFVEWLPQVPAVRLSAESGAVRLPQPPPCLFCKVAGRAGVGSCSARVAGRVGRVDAARSRAPGWLVRSQSQSPAGCPAITLVRILTVPGRCKPGALAGPLVPASRPLLHIQFHVRRGPRSPPGHVDMYTPHPTPPTFSPTLSHPQPLLSPHAADSDLRGTAPGQAHFTPSDSSLEGEQPAWEGPRGSPRSLRRLHTELRPSWTALHLGSVAGGRPRRLFSAPPAHAADSVSLFPALLAEHSPMAQRVSAIVSDLT